LTPISRRRYGGITICLFFYLPGPEAGAVSAYGLFTFAPAVSVALNFPGRVAYLSGVAPLRGRARDSADIARRSLLVVGDWRARINALEAAGWDEPARPGRRWRLLNCPPASLAVTPSSSPCHDATFCPHCHARQAVVHWRALDRLLFPPPATPGVRPLVLGNPGAPRPLRRNREFAVVERVVRRRMPFFRGHPPEYGLVRFLAHYAATGIVGVDARLRAAGIATRRAELGALRRAGAAGGLAAVRVGLDRARDGDDAYVGWAVALHQVLLVPSVRLPAFRAARCVVSAAAAKVRLRVTPDPTRLDLARATARAARYSAFLLRADPALALAYRAARAGRRLSTRFGTALGV
jgi:hypothetical protein